MNPEARSALVESLRSNADSATELERAVEEMLDRVTSISTEMKAVRSSQERIENMLRVSLDERPRGNRAR